MTLHLVDYIYFLFEEHIKLFLCLFINKIYNKLIVYDIWSELYVS